jgi:hypothetical protein
MGDGIVVQHGEKGRAGPVESLVDCGSEAQVETVLQDDNSAVRWDGLPDPSLSAIVNDDDLEIAQRLALERAETFEQLGPGSQRRYDYGYPSFRQP